MNSTIQTLQTLINLNGDPKKARDIGLLQEPTISLNTCIKDISFIRIEFGSMVILDDLGVNSPHSKEKRYFFNKKWKLEHYGHCKDICDKTREMLISLLKAQKHPLETGKHLNIERGSEQAVSNPIPIDEGRNTKIGEYLRLNSFANTFTLLHGCFMCTVYYRKAENEKRCKVCK